MLVAFRPSGRYVATASEDETARIFEAKTGREIGRLTHSDVVQTVAFSADGLRLATGTANGVVGMLDFGDARRDDASYAESSSGGDHQPRWTAGSDRLEQETVDYSESNGKRAIDLGSTARCRNISRQRQR